MYSNQLNYHTISLVESTAACAEMLCKGNTAFPRVQVFLEKFAKSPRKTAAALLSTGKCKIIDLSEEYTFGRGKIEFLAWSAVYFVLDIADECIGQG